MTRKDGDPGLIKKIWRMLVPEKIKTLIGMYLYRLKNSKKMSYGEKNKNEIFWLIRCERIDAGLYSVFFDYILDSVIYAKKKGYIPVIDLKNYYVAMLQDLKKKGQENAWEYYYEQMDTGYSLEEVYQSKRVMLRPVNERRSIENSYSKIYNEKLYDTYHDIINNYLHLQPELKRRIESEKKRLFPESGKILGVGIRATYRSLMLLNNKIIHGHPLTPSCKESIGLIEEYMTKWNCNYVFLMCDDREYHDAIVHYFGEKCLYIVRPLMHFFNNGIPEPDYSRQLVELKGISNRERNEYYILETYLLADCDCLYAPVNGGVEFAYFMNGKKYEHCEFYDRKLYNIKN